MKKKKNYDNANGTPFLTNREKKKIGLLQELTELHKQKRWQEIIDISEAVLESYNENPYIYHAIAFAYYFGPKNFQKAVEFAEMGLRIEINNPLMHIYFISLIKLGKLRKAIEYFRKHKASYLTYDYYADFIISNLIYCYLEEDQIQPCLDELEPYFEKLKTRHQTNFYYNAACLYAQTKNFEQMIHYILLSKNEGIEAKTFLESNDFEQYRGNETFSFILKNDYSKKVSFHEYHVHNGMFREIKLPGFEQGYRKYKIIDNSGSLDEYGKTDHVEEYSQDFQALVAYANKRTQILSFGIEELSPYEQNWVTEIEELISGYLNENPGNFPTSLVLSWEINIDDGIYYAGFKNFDNQDEIIEKLMCYQHDIEDYEFEQKKIESPASMLKIATELIKKTSYKPEFEKFPFYIIHQINEFDFDFAIAIENGQARII